jgi:hypothetical protein
MAQKGSKTQTDCVGVSTNGAEGAGGLVQSVVMLAFGAESAADIARSVGVRSQGAACRVGETEENKAVNNTLHTRMGRDQGSVALPYLGSWIARFDR